MDVLHITATKNIPSIMKTKIMRRKPLLTKFNGIMESYYGDSYNEDKGLVFGFPESIHHRDKIIKDFIYWKTWGDDRNRVIDTWSDEQHIEMQNVGVKAFSHLTLKEDHYSILLLDIEHEPFFDYYHHKQSSDMGVLWNDMDIRYEHNDKPLTLMNYDIQTSRIKKIVGTAESVITKQNRVNVFLNI